MPNCRIIFHRRAGPGMLDLPGTGFAAEKLRPLIAGKMSNGSALHIIHDRVPSLPLNQTIRKDFEAMIRRPAVLRIFKKSDREWREQAKRDFAGANRGKSGDHLRMGRSPEEHLILQANMRSPNTVINHLGHYPIEAAIENTLYNALLSRADRRRMASMGDAVELVLQAHEALASCALLRDFEMIKQVAMLGQDAVVFRGLHHVYLADLDEYDIPIVVGGGPVESRRVMNFADYVRSQGVTIEYDAEPLTWTFAEESVSLLCSGKELRQEIHRKLALLQIIFSSHLRDDGLPSQPEERIKAAYGIALGDFERVEAEVLG
jgi:hypothetical protein